MDPKRLSGAARKLYEREMAIAEEHGGTVGWLVHEDGENFLPVRFGAHLDEGVVVVVAGADRVLVPVEEWRKIVAFVDAGE